MFCFFRNLQSFHFLLSFSLLISSIYLSIYFLLFIYLPPGTDMNDWWDNGNNQIAFCRGDKGFIAINNDGYDLKETLQVKINQS